MSGGRRRSKRGRSKARTRPEAEGFWREDETLSTPEPVGSPSDPTAVLRSLGNPPVPQADELVNEFLKTALRASSLAAVLAESVGLSDTGTPDTSG